MKILQPSIENCYTRMSHTKKELKQMYIKGTLHLTGLVWDMVYSRKSWNKMVGLLQLKVLDTRGVRVPVGGWHLSSAAVAELGVGVDGGWHGRWGWRRKTTKGWSWMRHHDDRWIIHRFSGSGNGLVVADVTSVDFTFKNFYTNIKSHLKNSFSTNSLIKSDSNVNQSHYNLQQLYLLPYLCTLNLDIRAPYELEVSCSYATMSTPNIRESWKIFEFDNSVPFINGQIVRSLNIQLFCI